jgi:ABC-type multidrug transport system fused ATPase/permease subunit
LSLAAFFNVFSLSAIVPLLQILFGIEEANFVPMAASEITSYASLLEFCKVNLLYFLQEQISVNGELYSLAIIALFICITSVCGNMLSYFADYVRIPVRTGVMRDMRKDLYKKILDLSPRYLSNSHTGDIISRLTTDANEIEYSIGSMLDIIIKNPVKIVVYVITLFSISTTLSWYAMGLLLMCTIILVLIGYSLKHLAMRSRSLQGVIMSKYEETLRALPLLRMFTAEHNVSRIFDTTNEDTRNAFNKMNRHYALLWPMSEIVVILSLALLLWYGGSGVFQGSIDVDAAQLIYFLIIFHSIVPQVSDMTRAGFGIRKAMASVDRINVILQHEAQQDAQTDSTKLDSSTVQVEYRGVSFAYNDETLLEDVNLSIAQGEKIAVVGATGTGKSTLLLLMSRLFDVNQGEILINGVSISNIPLKHLRSMISYAGQDSMLFNDTVYNNITLWNEEASVEYVKKVAQITGLYSFTNSPVDILNQSIGDGGMCLSSGQKQCVALARAMLKEANIYILDEAFSAIDKNLKETIKDSLVSKLRDKTVIVVSHQLENFEQFDRVYEIRGKRLNCIYSHE